MILSYLNYQTKEQQKTRGGFMKIHIFGSVFYDILCYGEKPHSGELYAMPGGSAFNISIGLKKMGYDVYLHCVYGDDCFGENIEQSIIKNGMNRNFINSVSGETGLFIANNDKPVSVRIGVNSQNWPELKGIDYENSVCVVLATENPGESTEKIMSKNWFRKIVDIGPNCKVDIIADLIMGNENECKNRNCHIIKMGKSGASYDGLFVKGNELELPFTIGAGDVFDCAIIDSSLRGEEKLDALKKAVESAEKSCLIPGSSKKMELFDNKI